MSLTDDMANTELYKVLLSVHVEMDPECHDTDIVKYLAEKLVDSGIVNPNDLGFLCTGQSGVRESVFLSLDPHMPASAKHLLCQSCARQAPLRAGILDLAALALPRIAAGALPGKAKCLAFEPAAAAGVPVHGAAGKPSAMKRQACDPPFSLAQQDRTRMDRAIDCANQLFLEYGKGTPRYQQLVVDCSPSTKHAAAFRRCLQARTRSATSLRSKLLAARRFLTWLRVEGHLLTTVRDWDVAAWVELRSKSSVSGGAAALSALRWVEAAFGVQLHTSSSLVRLQADAAYCAPGPRPVSAKCPTERHVAMWEQLLTSTGSNVVIRCFAGMFCALAHGMLRWSDLQRTSQLELTQDAVTGLACMKNQKFLTRWAAPRYGFTNCDWGSTWMKALEVAGLPGPDFILWNASKHVEYFCNTIADYSGAQKVMRFLLGRPPFSLPQATVKQYTLHGFRHIYTTAMRQLNFPADQIDDAGHWRRGSDMPRVYDAAEATSELVAKDKVRCAIAAGWRRSSPGCLPPPSPVPLGVPSTPGAAAVGAPLSPVSKWPASTSSSSQQGAPPPLAGPLADLKDSPAEPVQVINISTKRLHKWSPTGGSMTVYTMCRKMRCGHPLSPAKHAIFETGVRFEAKHFDLCVNCYRV